MKKIKWVCFALLFVCSAVLIGIRIYQVNHSELTAYFPVRTVYPKEQTVPLNNGHYYFTNHNWEGYSVTVKGVEIKRTDDLLTELHAPENFMKSNNLIIDNHHNYEYVCLVTAEFQYDITAESESDPINLMEFSILGPDYVLQSATELFSLEELNPKLQGNFMFQIVSGNPFVVSIPFFINTGFETGMTVDYVKSSHPGLLVTYYPEECCIELF